MTLLERAVIHEADAVVPVRLRWPVWGVVAAVLAVVFLFPRIYCACRFSQAVAETMDVAYALVLTAVFLRCAWALVRGARPAVWIACVVAVLSLPVLQYGLRAVAHSL